jgi:hypothetical protein
MKFIKADCGDKMGLYFDALGFFSDNFPKMKIINIHFMYLDSDTEEDNPVMIAEIGTDIFHVCWYDEHRLIEKSGSFEFCESFLEIAYRSVYGK